MLKRTIFVALGILAASIGAAQTPIYVTVNGEPVTFNEGKPVQKNGRVLVPLRGVFEKMGASVRWNGTLRQITASKDDSLVQLRIGSRNATVDGKTMTMDVPASIIGGSTMVPLRFVSEALGADVDWQDRTRTAVITLLEASHSTTTTESHKMKSLLKVNSVIPVTLSTELSSNDSKVGDTFSSDLRTSGADNYGGLPAGTKIEGHVVAAKPHKGKNPGMLQLGFDRVVFPDGSVAPVNGSLVGLDSKSVSRADDGTLMAKPGKARSRNPIVYVGYGAGAGAVLAVLTKGNIVTNSIIGGALGFLVDTLDKKKASPSDVKLAEGTEFGVRLNAPIRH